MFTRYIQELQERNELNKVRLAAYRNRKPPIQPTNREMSLLVKVSIWAFVGALSAIAFSAIRNGTIRDWQSWLWTWQEESLVRRLMASCLTLEPEGYVVRLTGFTKASSISRLQFGPDFVSSAHGFSQSLQSVIAEIVHWFTSNAS